MNGSDISVITHPFVLIGISIFFVISLLKFFDFSKITKPDNAIILNKLLNYAFVIALLVICFGFYVQIKRHDKQPSKLALVISNHNYDHYPNFKRSVHNADEHASILDKNGYRIIRKYNATKEDLEATIRHFMREWKRMPNVSETSIYYSGLAMKCAGSSYFLPVDAPKKEDNRFFMSLVPLGVIYTSPSNSLIDHLFLHTEPNLSCTNVAKTGNNLPKDAVLSKQLIALSDEPSTATEQLASAISPMYLDMQGTSRSRISATGDIIVDVSKESTITITIDSDN